MKFHLIAGSLVAVVLTIVYFIATGVQRDFEEARSQIRQEAVKTVKKKRSEHLTSSPAPTISKVDEKKVFNPVVFKAPTRVAEATSSPPEVDPPGIMVERIGNDEYWCRDGVEPQKEKNPVRCYYSGACYGCMGSTVIPPDSEGVIPFCDNGTRAEIFSIECCPHSAGGGDMQCPLARECLHADAVPESFCTCNNRPDCRYVDIGGDIQCVCIQ